MRRVSAKAGNAAVRSSAVRASSTEAGATAAAAAEATAAGPKPGSLKGQPRSEFLYLCCIFAITGSSAAYFVRPAIRALITAGSGSATEPNAFGQLIGIAEPAAAGIVAGPWQFRLMYFMFMTPMYSMLLFTFGTLLGRGVFFRHFLVKMWGRMMPHALHQRFERLMVGHLKA